MAQLADICDLIVEPSSGGSTKFYIGGQRRGERLRQGGTYLF